MSSCRSMPDAILWLGPTCVPIHPFRSSFAGGNRERINSRRPAGSRWPTLVFNPHEQFERLRTDGQWKRMQEIRASAVGHV